MKKILSLMLAVLLSGCVSLSHQEKITLRKLQHKGIEANVSADGWEKPASPFLAGFLNILPGVGNFYLGTGAAADGIQWAYGLGNLLLWPISVVWGVPQAYIDAKTLNERDLVFFYQYAKEAKKGFNSFDNDSSEEPERPQWVDLYEKEGYIGQTDKKAIYYVGYGESVLYKPAHKYAVADAYEKAMASITGYGDSSERTPLHGMRLISEYKEDAAGKIKVWLLYSYSKVQMEKDMLDYQKKNKAKTSIP